MVTRRAFVGAALSAAAAAAGCAHARHSAAPLTPGQANGWSPYGFPPPAGGGPTLTGGAGPPVVVLHEILGRTANTFALGDRLRTAGFQVYLPRLFGKEGGEGFLGAYFKSCGSRQFNCAAGARSSPIVDWIAALCEDVGAKTRSRVGVIGMCLTGAFPLAALRVEAVVAPVLCQPTIPFGLFWLGEATRLGLSDAEVRTARERRSVPILGMRFTQDSRCPASRFAVLSELFGARFQAIEIPSGVTHPGGHHISARAHSVLGSWYDHTPGHPTRAAFDRMVGFLRAQLGEGS